MSKSKEALIDKIAKLLNHAESAESIGSMAEAEAFAATAHRLMLEHRIEMTDIEYASFEEEQQVANQFVPASEFGFKKSTRRLVWAERLASAVAKAHFCRAFGRISSNTIQFIGATQDREQCIRVFLKLMATRDLLGKQEYSAMRKRGEDTKGFWSGWNKGFADGVYVKVLAEIRDAEAELKRSNETGLIRIGNAIAKVEDYVQTNLRLAKGSSGTNYGKSSAYSAGRAAGRGSNFKNNQLK